MSIIKVNAIQHTSANGSNMTLFANGNVAMTTANTILAVGNTVISNAGISVGGSLYSSFGPAFSAYASVAVSLTSGAFTKVGLQTEEFDTANCFDSTTNYRFTPNVAGYYQFSGSIQMEGAKILVVSLAKNGAEYRRGIYTNPTTVYAGVVSGLIYLNGSTDYVELWGYNGTAGAINTQVGQPYTWMTGFLARPA